MEDDRRVREYYQVNLDTGRIFWIAFLLGLVLVGILIFGIYVGGGKLKKGMTTAEKPSQAGGEAGAVTGKKGELPFLSLFDNGLTAETKYIDTGEAEKTALESSRKTIETARLFDQERGEFDAEAAYAKAEQTPVERVRPSRQEAAREPASGRARYIEKGDYYIQVAAFTKAENADNLAGKLRKQLYKVTIEEAKVGEQQFYRVRVGPFETKSLARNTMTTMSKHFGLNDPFVVKKDS
jgi:cell division septation protein DedD